MILEKELRIFNNYNTCALMAEEPDEKLRIALTILPATGLPTLEANAPLGQPVMLFTITGGPNTRLL